MRIFHKYDKDKDKLRIDYDPVSKLIYFSIIKDNTWVPVSKKDLNKKTKKWLDTKNNDQIFLGEYEYWLRREREFQQLKKAGLSLGAFGYLGENEEDRKYKYELYLEKRYQQYKKAGLSLGAFGYLGENEGSISNDMDKFLTKVINDSHDSVLGIHRTSYPRESIVPKVFEEGLEINGHLMGTVRSDISLDNTVGYYPDNIDIIKQLMYANVYKYSQGSFLIRIPFEDFNNGSDIYVRKNGCLYLNPVYIIGYVPLEENHYIKEVIKNPHSSYQINTYSYQNTTETRVLSSGNLKGPNKKI